MILPTDGNFVGQIHFLDKDGFEIKNDYFNLGDNVPVAPYSEHTFTGRVSGQDAVKQSLRKKKPPRVGRSKNG
jgi:hypothetical protein